MPKLTDDQKCAPARKRILTPKQLAARTARDRARYLLNRDARIAAASKRVKGLTGDARKKYLASKMRWQKKNPAKSNSYGAKRRALELKATVPWANKQAIEDIYALAFTISAFFGEPYEVDHIVPLNGRNVKGFHVENNLQVLHPIANKKKGNRLTNTKTRTCLMSSDLRQ